MKKILCFACAALCVTVLFILAVEHLTEGFSLSKIQSDLPFSTDWVVKNPPEEVTAGYLSQNFFYLGRGSQCYVFESEDKQVVLKFFRHSRYRLPKITRLFTTPAFVAAIQKQKREAKEQKLKSLFQSCKLAYEELQEESGLAYLHLNQTHHLGKTVVLYDKLKRAYPIQIDDYTFILQKQGEQIYPYLAKLLKKGKQLEAQKALASLTTILASRLAKGIKDQDAVVEKNSGFLAGRAFFLDIGSFSKEPIPDRDRELWKDTRKLQAWLQKHDPVLASYFESLLNSCCSEA